MSDKVSLIDQTTASKRDDSLLHLKKSVPSSSADFPHDHIASLQHTIGNRALYRLFKAGVLQPKLKVGRQNDPYEQEADRVADHVMSMTESAIQREPG